MKKLLSKFAFKGYCEQFYYSLNYVAFDLELCKTYSVLFVIAQLEKCDFFSQKFQSFLL